MIFADKIIPMKDSVGQEFSVLGKQRFINPEIEREYYYFWKPSWLVCPICRHKGFLSSCVRLFEPDERIQVDQLNVINVDSSCADCTPIQRSIKVHKEHYQNLIETSIKATQYVGYLYKLDKV